jgi:hypothetical protein
VTKENSMAKQNRDDTASAGLLERSADRIGAALGTAVRRMEDLGGAVTRKVTRRTTRRKARGTSTRRRTRTAAARGRRKSKGTSRKKR